MITLTLYSRPGCHLCDDMKTIIQRVSREKGDASRPAPAVMLDEVDISKDPALETRYGLEIPVLFVDGQKVAKYRMTEEELRRVLAARQEG